MSPEAIARRLAEVGALNRLCASLAEAGERGLPSRSVDERLTAITRGVETGQADAVVAELVALWNAPESELDFRRRHLELVPLLTRACHASQLARERFSAIRDQTRPGPGQRAGTASWLALNDALDEPQVTLDWFDERVARGDEVVGFSALVCCVLARGRPEDYVRLMDDPAESLAVIFGHTPPGLPPAHDFPVKFRDILSSEARHEAAMLVRAVELVTPGSDLRRQALALDPSAELADRLEQSFDELRAQWLVR